MITGVSGFIGGHVALAFLDAGFRVRGVVRSNKFQTFVETVKLPGIEFVQLDDLSTGDFSEALKGVDIPTAIDGTLNVLKQAAAAGIEKIVITGSSAAVFSPDMKECFEDVVLGDTSWGQITLEEAKAKSDKPLFVYLASKLLSERAVWKFAREHPEVDISTILPTLVFGPFAKGFPLPSSPMSLSSNGIIYQLMTGRSPNPMPPWVVDVRDVAQIHLKAALLPRLPASHDVDIEERRFFVNAWIYTWKEAIKDLNKRRPDVRTVKSEDVVELAGVRTSLETARVEKALGMREWIRPEKMVEDTIDSIKEAQKTWSA